MDKIDKRHSNGFTRVKNENLVRQNFNLDKRIVARVEQYADELGISKASAYAVALTNYFNNLDTQQAMQKMSSMISNGEPNPNVVNAIVKAFSSNNS